MTVWRALAVALTLAVTTAPIARACDLPPSAADMIGGMGAAVNGVRGDNGRAALARNALLDTAAQRHACWMSVTGKFGHAGAEDSQPSDRVRSAGYRAGLTSENIAMGQPTASAVVADWMKSKGHRDNILRKAARDYGVGVALLAGRPVWVMLYAAP